MLVSIKIVIVAAELTVLESQYKTDISSRISCAYNQFIDKQSKHSPQKTQYVISAAESTAHRLILVISAAELTALSNSVEQ